MRDATFGEELLRLREAKGHSVRALARAVPCGKTHVSNLEHGNAIPDAATAQILDDLLGAGGVLVLLAASMRHDRGGLPVLPTGALSLATRPALTGPTSEEILMAAEESARIARAAARAGSTAEQVELFGTDVRRLAAAYLVAPPYALFRPLAALRTDVFRLIDSYPEPAYLRALYLAAGQATALLAHASADLGQPVAAEAHARTAWLCADRADDPALRVYVRWVQANVAYWSGDYRQAAELAASARPYATGGSSLLRLASQEARAHAALGDAQAVDRALGVGLDAQNAANEARTSESGVFHFNPGKAAYYSSEVRLALGGADNHRRAVADAERSVALLTSGPAAEQSAELIAAGRQDLAAAHLALGDTEAAAAAIRPVLALPSEMRTAPITGRMQSLSPKLSHPSTADLAEQVELFLAYPATRALPT